MPAQSAETAVQRATRTAIRASLTAARAPRPSGVQPGDLIITEIMNNLAIAEDAVGEWVGGDETQQMQTSILRALP